MRYYALVVHFCALAANSITRSVALIAQSKRWFFGQSFGHPSLDSIVDPKLIVYSLETTKLLAMRKEFHDLSMPLSIYGP